jgi:hypothetical protein
MTRPCTPASGVPLISTGVMPVRTCTPARFNSPTSARPLRSTDGRAISFGSAATRRMKGDVSSTAATSAPALTYCDATKYSNGPVPMNTTRRPIAHACAFRAICDAPRL